MTKRSDILNLIRWVAALMVVMGHLRSIIFEDYSSLVKNPFYKALYFITGLGHQAVILFFVLSGYLIGRTVIEKHKEGQFSLYSYIISRIVRIYIVLVPALLLTIILDKIGISIDNKFIYTTCDYITSLEKDPASRLTTLHALSSLIMLQNLWLPVLGSNGPLWSLSPEFWYYMIFPALIGVFYKGYQYQQYLLPILLVLIFLWIAPFSMFIYFLIWLCGLIAYFFQINGLYFRVLFMILFFASIIYSRIYTSNFQIEIIIAIALALLLSTLDNLKIDAKNGWLNRKMASFSYSLYLIHFPLGLCILVITDRFITPAIKIQMSIHSLIIFVVILLVIYVISYLFAKITEYKTDNLKKVFIN